MLVSGRVNNSADFAPTKKFPPRLVSLYPCHWAPALSRSVLPESAAAPVENYLQRWFKDVEGKGEVVGSVANQTKQNT